MTNRIAPRRGRLAQEQKTDAPTNMRLAVLIPGRVLTSSSPKETKRFANAAKRNHRLREDLKYLLAAYPNASDLRALADALIESAKRTSKPGRVPQNPPDKAPNEAIVKAQYWGALIAMEAEKAGGNRNTDAPRKMMTRAISEIAPLLPRANSEAARRDRAQELIDHYVKTPPPTERISREVVEAIGRMADRAKSRKISK